MADEEDRHEVVRDASGRFIVPPKGGRPPGPTRAEKLRAALEPHQAEQVEGLLALTRSADGSVAVQAKRLYFEYLAPKPKPEPERVEIPDLAGAVTVADKARAVVQAVAAGKVSPESAEKLLRMLDVVNRAVTIERLEQEIAALREEITRGRSERTIDGDGLDLV